MPLAPRGTDGSIPIFQSPRNPGGGCPISVGFQLPPTTRRQRQRQRAKTSSGGVGQLCSAEPPQCIDTSEFRFCVRTSSVLRGLHHCRRRCPAGGDGGSWWPVWPLQCAQTAGLPGRRRRLPAAHAALEVILLMLLARFPEQIIRGVVDICVPWKANERRNGEGTERVAAFPSDIARSHDAPCGVRQCRTR